MLQSTEIPYREFKTALRAGEVKSVSISEEQITGTLGEEGQAFYTVRVEDSDLIKELEAQDVEIQGQVTKDGGLTALLGWILPLVLMFGFWYWMMGRMREGSEVGGGVLSFGKSKARVVQGEQTGVTFKDVGGADEAVIELQEVTEFLKNPARFPRL